MKPALTITPTWAALAPALIAVLENGTEEGRTIARAELLRMAKLADGFVALMTEDTDR